MSSPCQTMERHARHLTNVNPNLPDRLAVIARAFVEPGRALGSHNLELFERLIAPNRAMEGPTEMTLHEVLSALPNGPEKDEAVAQLSDARLIAGCGEWGEAIWALFHAKNAACVAALP